MHSRKLIASVALIALVTGCATPQQATVSRDTPAVAAAAPPTVAEQLITAATSNTHAYELLSRLTDDIGPRLSGSRGAELAVRWATDQFRAWGIEVRNEPVMVPQWVRGAEEARLVSHLDREVVLLTLGGSVATPEEGLTAEVMVVRNFDELTARAAEAKGKIVLFNAPMDLEKVRAGRAFEAYSEVVGYRGAGAIRAAQHGAVAALVRSVASASLRTPHTGALRYDEKFPRIPAAAVTTEDADLLQRLADRGQKIVMHLRLTPKTLPDVESANVVAEIKGSTNPEEIVLIGAHLDSWDVGQGAIDNGSGSVMIMETMRLIKAMNLQPRRTIRAVLFMNEENGLRGARAYAERHRAEISNHVAAIESDAGAAAPLGFITTLSDAEIERFRPAVTALQQIGATRLTHAPRTGADTSPLVAAGVVGFGLVPDPVSYFHYHHTPADTLDKINPKELAADTAAVAALTWTLANMPERFPQRTATQP